MGVRRMGPANLPVRRREDARLRGGNVAGARWARRNLRALGAESQQKREIPLTE